MAKVRIGIATQFELENELVGIGTDNPTNTLQALGNIQSSDAKAIGVSTFAAFDGFTDSKARIEASAGAKQGTTSGEIIIEGTVNVSSGTTFTSGPENLTVTDNFTLPGISDDKPSAGTTRFNENLRALEFYTGSEWRAVNSYIDMSNRGRAVFGGGQPGPSKIIDYLELSTLGNALYFGDLINARANKTACADTTRGLFLGGNSPSDVTDIDYVTISSAGNGIDFGDITAARAYCTGCNSSTRGFVVGGWAGSNPPPNVIDFTQIQTLGNSVDFGDLFTGRYGHGTTSSPTRAVVMGGANNNSGDDRAERAMEFFTLASSGNATDFGETDVKRRMIMNGSSNGTRGIFGGGATSVNLKTISYVNITSAGNAEYFGDLTEVKQRAGSANTATRAVFYNTASPSMSNTIDYINFTTSGNAMDFGDAADQKNYTKGGTSDSNGGLGGF